MSSSVVIVNITRSRRRTTDRATEEALLGWSVLQDLAGVSFAAVLLAVAGVGERPVGEALASLALFAGVAVVAARVLPAVLSRLRDAHDLFLIVSMAAGLVLAAAGAVVFHVPMALAAFVAGLAISDRPETAEARRRLLPFRDVFAVLFFVAVGSLIDPGQLGAAAPLVGLLLALVALAKVGVVGVLARVARLRARPRQLAVGLGQMGEFGYVLGAIGLTAGALTGREFTAVLGSIVVSIAASAVLVRAAGSPGGRGALVDEGRVRGEREREGRRRQRGVGLVARHRRIPGHLVAHRLLEPQDHAVGAIDRDHHAVVRAIRHALHGPRMVAFHDDGLAAGDVDGAR